VLARIPSRSLLHPPDRFSSPDWMSASGREDGCWGRGPTIGVEASPSTSWARAESAGCRESAGTLAGRTPIESMASVASGRAGSVVDKTAASESVAIASVSPRSGKPHATRATARTAAHKRGNFDMTAGDRESSEPVFGGKIRVSQGIVKLVGARSSGLLADGPVQVNRTVSVVSGRTPVPSVWIRRWGFTGGTSRGGTVWSV